MRIVGGKYRGHPLQAPKARHTRPTSDRVREQIFNILVHAYGQEFEDCRVADIFAGTGAMGLEALSRGAAQVCFVENDPNAIKIIRQNVASLGAGQAVEVLNGDARRVQSADAPFDLLFLDPPYDKGLAETALPGLMEMGWIGGNSIVVVESKAGEDVQWPGGLVCLERRNTGGTDIAFLELSDKT